jgi:hypothetical protein
MKRIDHPLYITWAQMRRRCNSPNATSYHRYGGRGITIDKRWDDFWVFVNDMGDKPSHLHTLDRIDNDGPYGPGNCRWATRKEQSRNTKRVRWIETERGRVRAADLAAEAGLSVHTILSRHSKGLSLEKILATEKIKPPIRREVQLKAWEKKRTQTHCKRGHPLEGDNLIPNKKGQRICKICGYAKSKAWRDRRKQLARSLPE